MTGRTAPVADWVTIPDLYRDPFPIYARLRAEGGVHWVPSVGRYLVTSYDAVHETELDQEIFSANETDSLQIRAMGHSMLRRDDPEHYVERKAWQPALRPGVVKRVWAEKFRQNAEKQLQLFAELGSGADLVWDFAAPYVAENLRTISGLYNADQADLQRWSQTLIDATGNYADDPEVWRRGEESFAEVDDALDEMLVWHTEHPDESLISQLLRIPGYLMPLEKIRANLKMTIGGGLNEPRDALGVAAWALLQNPDQLAAVRTDPSLWNAAFDESIRWIAPIGMYSRQTTREIDLAGVRLPAGARLGVCILAANRDETVWDRPEKFDLLREVKPHLAFGKGVHVCQGAWVARSSVADIALPMLFDRLDGLRLSADHEAEVRGWVFRGMTKLPVEWDTVREGGSRAAEAPAPRVAVVGAGPAGCFTAQAVRKVFPEAPIDVFDQLPTPFGLVRYGVAADHAGTKAVVRQFERLFTNEGVAFRGNVGLDRDTTLAELRERYDAVVLATGMREDAALGIPGGELVRGAGRITRSLNSYPDEEVPAPLGERVAIIGHGNVALDIARLLARDAEGLEGSDIADDRHQALAASVRTVHLIGRSVPSAAKFDPVMVRELAQLPGVEHVVHGAGSLAGPEGRDAREDAVRELLAPLPAGADATPTRLRIEWWFGAAPSAITERDGGALELELTLAETGSTAALPVEDVITAIGFAANEGSPIVPGAHGDGRVAPGLYAAGWLRRGPRGTIPDQRSDAQSIVQRISEDLRSGAIQITGSGLSPVDGETDYRGWQRIDVKERLDAAPGRTRNKLTSIADMLAATQNEAFDVGIEAAGDAGGNIAPSVPTTVLYGTESGGAELVADSVARMIDGAETRSLAEITPGELEAGRFYLVICSTYGDGEVPSEARDFHDSARSGVDDLAGIRFAMFGMGDRSYERTYSRGSELVTEALVGAGATQIGSYGRHDAGSADDAAEVAVEWARGVLSEVDSLLKA